MTITALGAALASLAAVMSAHLPTADPTDHSRSTASADEFEYCTSPYVMGQNPNCTPVPTPSKDYKGEPIAVFNRKKVTGFEEYVYVNVLKNDAVEKKSKVKRVEIVFQKPSATGVYATVIDNKIRMRFENINPSGATIWYRVVDYKGRKSENTYLEVVTW